MILNSLMRAAVLGCSLLAFAVPASAQVGAGPEVYRGFSMYGSDIGGSGMVWSNNPSLNELYVDGEEYEIWFWQALEYDLITFEFVQSYASPVYRDPIIFLGLGDLHSVPGDEIVIALENGEVHIHHQVTKELLGVVDTGVLDMTAFAMADIQGDGTTEIAVLGNGGLHIFDDQSNLFWTFSSIYGEDLVFGQMDADPGLELASTDGTVVDMSTLTIQCAWPTGFGFDMEVSDFDNDGMEELIFSNAWDTAWAFDIDLCIPKWTIYFFNTLSMAVGDSDLDGVDELILGMGQASGVNSYRLDTQQQIWQMTSGYNGASAMLFHDLDGNGQNEVIWGAGAGSSGADHLIIGHWPSETNLWESVDLRGPFLGPVLADFNGDGQDEVVSVSWSSDSGYGDSRVVVLDQGSLQVDLSDELNTRGATAVDVQDVDNDGRLEILVTVGYHLEILEYGAAGFVPDGDIYIPQLFITGTEVVDIDGDGQKDAYFGGRWSGGPEVRRYDMITGLEVANSGPLFPYSQEFHALESGDLDDDGTLELAAVIENDGVHILDENLVVEAFLPGDYSSIQILPMGSGPPALLIGDVNGNLLAHRWDGSAYSQIGMLGLSSTHGIDAIHLPTGVPDFILTGIDGRLELHNRLSGGTPWTTAHYGLGFGDSIELLPGGEFVTAGSAGIYFFRL